MWLLIYIVSTSDSCYTSFGNWVSPILCTRLCVFAPRLHPVWAVLVPVLLFWVFLVEEPCRSTKDCRTTLPQICTEDVLNICRRTLDRTTLGKRSPQPPWPERTAGRVVQREIVALMGPMTPKTKFTTDQKQQNYIPITVSGIYSHSKAGKSNVSVQISSFRGTIVKDLTPKVNKTWQNDTSLSTTKSKPPWLRIS